MDFRIADTFTDSLTKLTGSWLTQCSSMKRRVRRAMYWAGVNRP